MCNTNPNAMVIPYGLKVSTQSPYLHFGVSPMALDIQRAQQLYDYSTRLQYGLSRYPNALGLSPYHPNPAEAYMHHYFKDPRARFMHEEPKPNHSYIGLIAMAILSSRDKKLVLSDIYQWILDNYPYFRTRGPGWRNSIRHNLSLNDCFIKSGRSANGKGHYWAIHPANVDDFQKGDFRRRRAQRRVRKHMGLSVPDDDDSPSPSPTSTSNNWDDNDHTGSNEKVDDDDEEIKVEIVEESDDQTTVVQKQASPSQQPRTRKRLFDVESLLAPDETINKRQAFCFDIRNIHFQSAVDNGVMQNGQSDSISIHSENSEKENISNSNLSDGVSTDSNVSCLETAIHHYSNIDSKDPVVIASRPSAFQNAHMRAWNSLLPYLATYPYIRRQQGLDNTSCAPVSPKIEGMSSDSFKSQAVGQAKM